MTCALADKDCRPPLQWHHAIKQQRLKRMFKYGAWKWDGHDIWKPIERTVMYDTDLWLLPLDEILGDTRNRIFLCSHHHELVTNGRVKVELPPSVWEFAAEMGLTGMLENDLRRAA